ncbi:DNA translocase FtsK 4TM domain-containing protein, partial [Nakamurella sp.]|uniref:DNA translocase FtsK 4TM domain-containing protein n=1 Tax=Nakamurella sp. TaxID=1869182 RepID=UPI003B3A5919
MGRGLRRLWLLVARWCGQLARAVGAGASATRSIDATHKRDGLALGLIAVALVCAVGTWLGAAGPIGALADDAVRVWVGVLAYVFPIALVVLAVVLMRSEPDPGHRPRRIAGGIAVVLSAAGVLHVLHVAGLADATTDSTGQRMTAGGTVGWLVGQPLFVGINTIPALLLLVLLGLFGVLLILGISLADVPRLIRGGWREIGHRSAEPDDGYDDWDEPADEHPMDLDEPPAAPRLRRPSRRRQGVDSGTDSDTDSDSGTGSGIPGGARSAGEAGLGPAGDLDDGSGEVAHPATGYAARRGAEPLTRPIPPVPPGP